MQRFLMYFVVIAVAIAAPRVQAQLVRIAGAFGGSAFNPQPRVEYSNGSATKIPTSYAVSVEARANVLPFDLQAFVSWDRLWSGADYSFTSSAIVWSGGFGKSFKLGYSDFVILAGLCNYDETLEMKRSVEAHGKVKNSNVGVMVGGRLIFEFFESVDMVFAYRLVSRDDNKYSGELSDGATYTLRSNSTDHIVTFGLGFRVGR